MNEYSAESGTTLADPSTAQQGPHTHVILDADLALILESPTNPRTTFDPAYIEELGTTIKAHGRVLQPILLRPLPASRVADTAHMKPRPMYEIVFGACRFRGSYWAKHKTIRATVEDLTDAQVLVIQLIENLKRKDLTALEEAEGYRRLMDEAAMSVDKVAEEIDRSKGYVYMRLKLLDLGQDGRAALCKGDMDASIAVLVARIPDGKLQTKAVKEIQDGNQHYVSGSYVREPMSYRQAQLHVQEKYMLKLGSAKFKITNADLVPAAGSCMTCSKRTGANPDIFADVKNADVCTDPPCFHKKEEAHAAAQVKEAKAKGQTIIAGKEAQELMPAMGYNAKFKGYKRLDDAADSPTDKPLRKIIGKQMQAEGIAPVKIAHPHKKGELVDVLPNEVVSRLLKSVQGQAEAAKVVGQEAKQFAEEKKAKAAAKAKSWFEREWREGLLARAWGSMSDARHSVFSMDLYRYLALRQANNLNADEAASMCKLLNLGKVNAHGGVLDWVKKTPNPDLALALLIMQHDSDPNDTHTYNGYIPNEGMMLVAGNIFGKGLAAVIKDEKAKAKTLTDPVEPAKPEPKKAPPPIAPLAQPNIGGGKAKAITSKPGSATAAQRKLKTTPEEALSGIAVAMQGLDRAATTPPEVPASEPGKTLAAAADPLYDRALALIIKEQKASKRLFKEELGIGQTKAESLLNMLEAAGKISACDERSARKVLVLA